MFAEILATGDEIRSGTLVDTNSAYISQKLEEAGIEVLRHQCVGDEMTILTDTLRQIGSRADIAVVTGGLGPTTDDITAEAAAETAGVKLELNESALEDIKAIFEKTGWEMSSSNRKQAMFPVGASILKNSSGTAPGFSMKIGKCRFYFVPGVPFEMKRMLEDYVLSDIVKLQNNKQIITVKTISTFGLGESTVGEKTAAVTDKFNVKLGLRATFPEVQVKLYAQGSNSNELDSVLSEASAWIKEQLGKYVFSMDGLPMEKVIGDILLSRNATLALAESCTGGLISDLITNVPGSSEYFLFSGVTYSNNAKMDVLGVRQETLENFGAVSEETVREMAEGARRISGADYALATSGIAGPDGGTDEKPVGTVCIGLATPEKTITKRRKTANRQLGSSQETRMRIKRWFAMMSLEILRRELTGNLDND